MCVVNFSVIKLLPRELVRI